MPLATSMLMKTHNRNGPFRAFIYIPGKKNISTFSGSNAYAFPFISVKVNDNDVKS